MTFTQAQKWHLRSARHHLDRFGVISTCANAYPGLHYKISPAGFTDLDIEARNHVALRLPDTQGGVGAAALRNGLVLFTMAPLSYLSGLLAEECAALPSLQLAFIEYGPAFGDACSLLTDRAADVRRMTAKVRKNHVLTSGIVCLCHIYQVLPPQVSIVGSPSLAGM